jgi:serine/threonine protein kinase
VTVCNTIAYAHSRGVIHRDLKPANIMLGKFGETLVVDWGLAKAAGKPEILEFEMGSAFQPQSPSVLTQAGTIVGTPAYLSPEQAAGRLEEVGPASDVYSLGATLYTLLTGQPPFGAKDLGVVLEKVSQGDFPPPRSVKRAVSRSLQAICLKAMALKPRDRYASPLELATAVERWLATPSLLIRTEKIAGFVGCLVLLGGVCFYFLGMAWIILKSVR